MKQCKYTIITGTWGSDNKETIGAFTETVGLKPVDETYQLNQTISRCCIVSYDPGFSPDIKYLEQYRAFCGNWELWIRKINSQEMRFRFILNGSTLSSDKELSLRKEGFKIDSKDALVQVLKFPLWGEPLSLNGKKGWYTEQIPQILYYPIEFDKDTERAYLKVENMLCEDGIVELVRYTGLEVCA